MMKGGLLGKVLHKQDLEREREGRIMREDD